MSDDAPDFTILQNESPNREMLAWLEQLPDTWQKIKSLRTSAEDMALGALFHAGAVEFRGVDELRLTVTGKRWQDYLRSANESNRTAWRAAVLRFAWDCYKANKKKREAPAPEAPALTIDTPPSLRDAESPTTTQPAEYVFRRDGDGWFIRAFGEQGHFRNLVGLEYIAMLLERPDTPVPVVYLVGGRVGRTTVKDAQADGLSVGTSRQPVADKGMLADIKRKIEDCRQDIEKAERHGDLVSAEVGRKELSRLTAQWEELIRPGGRSRDFDSDTEKMRKRILEGLRRAYETLGEGRMPRTERHFEQAITYQEGSYIYRASPRPDWMVKK